VLVLLMPFLREWALLFGPAEVLMLTLWGLTTIAVVVRGSVIKGLAAAGLGFLFSFVGFDPRLGQSRYTVGSLYLSDGLDLLAVSVGLFALAGTIELAVGGRTTISGRSRGEQLSGSTWEGLIAPWTHFWLFIRSSLIGTIVGIIPGVGGSVASFVAYSHAVQTAGSHRDRFGKGEIRGVLAPEAAVDAKDGGALVPTLALGIPGNSSTALLLLALSLHGLTPGREMLTNQANLAFVLIWSLFLSNWLTSILGLAAVNPLSRLTTVPITFVIPTVLVLATHGLYFSRGRIEDVIVAYVFGVFGYLMKVNGWPRIPLVIALVLGPGFERNLYLTLQLQQLGRISFWSRPLVISLIVFSLATLCLPFLRNRNTGKIQGTQEQ
jgi:putative tricarboxylic transport membrane protein